VHGGWDVAYEEVTVQRRKPQAGGTEGRRVRTPHKVQSAKGRQNSLSDGSTPIKKRETKHPPFPWSSQSSRKNKQRPQNKKGEKRKRAPGGTSILGRKKKDEERGCGTECSRPVQPGVLHPPHKKLGRWKDEAKETLES